MTAYKLKLLRRKAASEYLREAHGLERAPATLAKLAVIGGGPVFRRIGRVPYYSPEQLDEWVASKLSRLMHSTSDAAGATATATPALRKTAIKTERRASSLEQEGQSHA